jgi:hypothetical protein
MSKSYDPHPQSGHQLLSSPIHHSKKEAKMIKSKVDYKTQNDILEIGELGVSNHDAFKGHIILRTFSGYVSLTKPYNTWSFENDTKPGLWPKLQITRLPRGSTVILEVI